MAWSETMFIIQHFYNVFEVDERLTNLEYKTPLVARSVEGIPEDIVVEELTPGTLWFIKDDNDPATISALSVLTEDREFADPIPFSIDLNNVNIESDIKDIVSRMGLTAENYYDIIKLMLEILVTVPVARGGTGKTSISKDKMLIGNADNTFREIGFDSTPTQRSENLINSGALFEVLKKYAEKSHASTTTDYGVGTATLYGHLKITDDYESENTDAARTAISIKGIQNLLKTIQNYINMFQVIDEDTLYSGCISAYRPKGMEDSKLRLIDSYFEIQSNSTGNETLIIE